VLFPISTMLILHLITCLYKLFC